MMTRKTWAAVVMVPLLLGGLAQAGIETGEGWTRATPPGTKVAVGYLTLKNTGKVKRELLKITSPVAQGVSLHQSSVDASGVSRMWPIGKLALAPGEVLRFEPNGRHLMLEGLRGPLVAGKRVAVTLVFEQESPVTVQLDVRPLVDVASASDLNAGHEGHHR